MKNTYASHYKLDMYRQRHFCILIEKVLKNENGIPIFYHIYRRANNKAIICKELTPENRRFDTNIYLKFNNILKNMGRIKYWWLTEE